MKILSSNYCYYYVFFFGSFFFYNSHYFVDKLTGGESALRFFVRAEDPSADVISPHFFAAGCSDRN
jgi:hypothetical protein